MPSVTPDLVPPAAPLVPVFPLSDAARPLTLYPGAEGEVWVRWRLHADAVVGHGHRFPRADGTPAVVLRLRRLGVDGSAEPIREQRLRPVGLGGCGDVAFHIGDECALLEAELGLMNPEGGWLLLARSNRLQQARGLGLESLRPPPTDLDRDDATASAPESRTTRPERAVIVMSAIPVLTYADPAPATAALVIEAELRIHGWSTPNAEIDLFGRRYRVGPGGRFQLSFKVDDPELIRRALEQHPPPGSVDSR